VRLPDRHSGHRTYLWALALGMLTIPQWALSFSLVTYDGVAARWEDGKTIQIELDDDFSGHVDAKGSDGNGEPQNILETVMHSINTWKRVSGTDIQLGTPKLTSITTTPNYDGINQIKMYKSGWSNLSFQPPASALAVTISTYTNPNNIVDSDIFFNGDNFDWANFNDDGDQGYDIENVLTHELGHFLGLDHTSQDPNESEADFRDATMYYSSRPGEILRRDLNIKDQLGVQHLYSNVVLPKPEVYENPEPIQVDAASKAIRILGSNFRPTAAVVIVRNDGQGDINGRIVSVSDDEIVVKFPATTLQSGSYDLVVANAPDKFVRLPSGLEVNNPTISGTYESDTAITSTTIKKKFFGCRSQEPGNLWLFMIFIFASTFIKRYVFHIKSI